MLVCGRSVIVLLLASATPLLAGCDRQSPAPEQGEAGARGNALATGDPAAGGDPTGNLADTAAPTGGASAKLGTVDRSHHGETVPDVAFVDPNGAPVTLAAFAGKPLLVNLWATWCTPCIAELPTLDRLAARERDRLRVLTVSQDTDAGKVAPFLAGKRVTDLQPYADPKLGLSLAYSANLPTTILYDSQGREVWRMAGGADWASDGVRALLAEAR